MSKQQVIYRTLAVSFLFPLIIALMFMPLQGQGDSGVLFEKANRLYEEGRHKEALAEYLKLEKSVVNWKIFYNAANCYFKMGEFVRAKIYYLRAQRLAPFESSIEKNIEITDLRFSDKMAAPPPDFLERVGRRIESVLSLNMVSWILLLAALLLNYFLFQLMWKGRSRLVLYGVAFSLLFFLTVAGYHIQRSGSRERSSSAVVIQPDSRLRSGPGENNTVLFRVNPGLKVRIVDQSRDWVQVTASEQVAGWIRVSCLERI